jgi:hypothetical protein
MPQRTPAGHEHRCKEIQQRSHGPVFAWQPPLLVQLFPGHECSGEHVSVAQEVTHAHELEQLTPKRQLFAPLHSTSHRSLPHWIWPAQESLPEHVMAHSLALRQSTPPVQEPSPHWTLQSVPLGQSTVKGHLPGSRQSITHTLF